MKKTFLIKIGVSFLVFLFILFLMAVFFKPRFSATFQEQIQQQMGLSVKIQKQRSRFLMPAVFLSGVQVDGGISGRIEQVQINFSLTSLFSKNKRITGVILKNPQLTVTVQKEGVNPLFETILKQGSLSFRFPVEVQNATLSYPGIGPVLLTDVFLNVTPSSQFFTITGSFKAKGQPFTLSQLKITPQRNRDSWTTVGKITQQMNQLEFSLTLTPNNTQGFVKFSLTEAKKILDTQLLPFLTNRIEGVVSLDFAPRRRSFPSLILRFEEKGRKTALTGNLLWQYDLKNAFQNAVSGELTVRELSGNLRDLLNSYLDWEKIKKADQVNKVDLKLTFQKVPVKDISLKDFSLNLKGTTTQLFISDAKATLSTGGEISFEASLEKNGENPLLKMRFKGMTDNVRPIVSWVLDTKTVPSTLLNKAITVGELEANPTDIKLNISQLDIDHFHVNGTLNLTEKGQTVQLDATISDLNLDSYIPFKAKDEFPVEKLPAHIQEWLVAHWPKTNRSLYANLSVANSFYLNLPIESFDFKGKMKDNTWDIEKIRFFNLAGLGLEGSGKVLLKGNQLEIPKDFVLKINSTYLPVFLQRSGIAPVAQKSVLFDGALSLENNQLSITGIWQENDNPYENIEKKVGL